MQIGSVIIKVADQDKALSSYTSVVGFVKKQDVLFGGIQWLTVSAPEGAEGVELVLEPNSFSPGAGIQKALYDAGFSAAVLTTNDITAEYRRLNSLGVTSW